MGRRSAPSALRIFPVKAPTRAFSGRSASSRRRSRKSGARTTSELRTRTQGLSGLDGLADREVVAARVAEVLARGDDRERDGRHLLERGERGARAVLRRVVHGHDREVAERLREEGREQPLDVARLVVRDDRDEDARSFGRHAPPSLKERRAPAEAEKPADDARVRRGGVGPRVVGPNEREEREPQERARERRGPRDGAGAGGRVAREVAEEIPDVDGAEVAVGERLHRDAAHVRGAALGNVPDPPARFQEARAEIHVLEPRGREGGIEARERFEGVAPHEEGGGGGLLDVESRAAVLAEVAVAAKARVVREEAVDEKRLANERPSRRETAELKAVLAVALEARRDGGDGGVRVEGGEKRRERPRAVHERGVGVQEEDRLRRAALARGAVARGTEAEVRPGLDHAGARTPGDLRRAVRRGVVDDDDGHAFRHRGDRVAQVGGGVPGHDGDEDAGDGQGGR